MAKPFKNRGKWWIRFTDEFGKRRMRVFDDYAAADQLIGGLKVAFGEEMDLQRPRNDPQLKMLAGCLAARILIAHSADVRRKREFQTVLHPDTRARVAAFINENLEGGISLAMLAREVRMSASHFSTVFKASTGMTPEQYVLCSRLWKAQEMIRTGMHTIGQIAYLTFDFLLGRARHTHRYFYRYLHLLFSGANQR